MNKSKKIIGGSIANCVHVSGVYEFLRIAEQQQNTINFLGAAVDVNKFVTEIIKFKPDIVCISYRLTASGLDAVLTHFFNKLKTEKLIENKIFYFGGTPECIKVAKKFNYFTHFFKGEENFEVINNSLNFSNRLEESLNENKVFRASLFDIQINKKSIQQNNEYILPMIRHHFGLPTLEKTIQGIEKIAKAEVVDVISLATDQNAQEFFFEPQKMDENLSGAGGVPVRTEDDLIKIYQASQMGNYPRLRIYSGTQNLLKWAEMSLRTINNAWGAIPLFWYSELDGRSKRNLKTAIYENMQTIKWYAKQNIPVEINDSHQWSLRETADVMAVFDAYLVAYNAKKLGVKTYISQLMLNTPRLTSPNMDIAKMLAKSELIGELEDENFTVLKQIRAGLTHFSTDIDVAKGQLAASTVLAIALKPQIIHVVSYSEASHAATPENVIESCKIVKGVIRNMWKDLPDLSQDKKIIKRKNYLIKEAKILKEIFLNIFQNKTTDVLSSPECLSKFVKLGFLDAPQLRGNPVALGKVKTRPNNGGYDLVNDNGKVISISEYSKKLIQ